jgi:phage terminase large subunit-like protein
MLCKRKAEKRGLYDPKKKSLKVRKRLTDKPKVLGFKDFKASGLVRVLQREDAKNREVMDYFPEFALYPRKSARIESALTDAGFTQESRGKWVLRTNKFNIFVYT